MSPDDVLENYSLPDVDWTNSLPCEVDALPTHPLAISFSSRV